MSAAEPTKLAERDPSCQAAAESTPDTARQIDVNAMTTGPMTTNELKDWLRVGRHAAARLARALGGRKVCGYWILPTIAMPDAYLLDRGLVRPTTIESDRRKTLESFGN